MMTHNCRCSRNYHGPRCERTFNSEVYGFTRVSHKELETKAFSTVAVIMMFVVVGFLWCLLMHRRLVGFSWFGSRGYLGFPFRLVMAVNNNRTNHTNNSISTLTTGAWWIFAFNTSHVFTMFTPCPAYYIHTVFCLIITNGGLMMRISNDLITINIYSIHFNMNFLINNLKHNNIENK